MNIFLRERGFVVDRVLSVPEYHMLLQYMYWHLEGLRREVIPRRGVLQKTVGESK